MQRANIRSYRALAAQASVSRWQVQQLRAGKIRQMRIAVLVQLAEALQVSLSVLLSRFGLTDTTEQAASASQHLLLRQEYQRLQRQLAEQRETARSHLQAEALQTLESWLVQWPTIAKRARDKGEALPAAKVLPFVRPVEQLVADWGIEAIAPVDAEVPYDPQYHQLTGGPAQPGDIVRVTHSGQTHQGNLLHRAKVKPLAPDRHR